MDCTSRWDDVGRGMTSPTLDSTHCQQRRVCHDITALGQHTWSTSSVGHAITALGLHTRSDDFRCGMTSPPLDSTHSRTISGVALHHLPWTACKVGRRRAWHDITALGLHAPSDMARHHLPLTAHTVKQCRAWHETTSLGLHARSDDVGRGMSTPPLENTHGRMT